MTKCNVDNRTIFCRDNLEVLKGINSECIDLIYLDPPFNTKKVFTAPTGSSAEGASFSDIFKEKDIKDEWVDSIRQDSLALFDLLNAVKVLGGRNTYNYCYLVYMAIRLIECHRVLKDTGSIYLHCDPTMSHYLKLLLDCIFDEHNFRNEIIWGYKTGGIPKKGFAKKHDVLLFYSKTAAYLFNPQEEKSYTKSKSRKAGVVNYGQGEAEFLEDGDGVYNFVRMRDIWDVPYINSQAKERTGYPTQKPLALLERIIKASTNKGDTVLDPFCGCATTCVASEKEDRKWIGIDVSIKAYDLVKQRLEKEVYTDLLEVREVNFLTEIPRRTDTNTHEAIRQWVYVISNNSFKDFHKVGITKDCNARLSQYQIGDPNRGYKLEFKHLTDRYRELERHIHKKFPNNREWVNAPVHTIKTEIQRYEADRA